MKHLLMAGALALAGCGAEHRSTLACKMEAGPEPGWMLTALGPLGGVAMASTDEHKAWWTRFEACARGTRLAGVTP